MLDRKQQLTGDALPSVVQIENLENQIYQCALGVNTILKYILLDEDFEVLAFPDFFPYGEGGYYSEQSTKLPIRKYFKQHLLNVDIHFAQNMEYLFCAQYISDIKQNTRQYQPSNLLILWKNSKWTEDHSRNVIKSHCTRAPCMNRTSIQVFEEHQEDHLHTGNMNYMMY